VDPLMEIGPVLAFDDAVGLKVRALHERAAGLGGEGGCRPH
jgi:hypothetical protein